MEAVILLAAGAIFLYARDTAKLYEAKRESIFNNSMSSVDLYSSPMVNPYEKPLCGNRYFEEQIKLGVRPVAMTFGPKGVPMYYFPRPGGHGVYVVNTY